MASIYPNTPEPTEADWSKTIDANARSVFLFSKYAAPIMKRGGGGARIINFADWLPASGRQDKAHTVVGHLSGVRERIIPSDRRSRFGQWALGDRGEGREFGDQFPDGLSL